MESPGMQDGNVSINGTEESWVPGQLTGTHFAFTVVMFILAFPANLFLVLATLRHPQSCQHSYHLYITNYGVVNILQSFVLLISKIIEGSQPQDFLPWIRCRIYGYLVYCLGCNEVNAYLLITINRYICVVQPQLSKTVYNSMQNNALLIFAGWTLYPFILFPPLLGAWGQFGYDPRTRACNLLNTDGYVIFLMCSILLITVPTIVFSYGSILWVFYSTRKKLCQSNPRTGNKLVTAVAVTVLTYFVLYVPFMILNMLNSEASLALYTTARYLMNARMVAQPIVFCAFSPQIRKMFRSKSHAVKLHRSHPAADTCAATSLHIPMHSLRL